MLPQKIKALLAKSYFLPVMISGILGVGIILTVWQTANFFYQERQDSLQMQAALRSRPAVQPPAAQGPTLLKSVSEFHLFGHAIPNSKNIPLSALNLKLTGIFLGESEKTSKVSLLTNNQDEKLYGVDETLPNGAVIEKIFQNEVIIKYNGQLERLILYSLAK